MSEHELWYASPAARWEEALPVGNGRLGGMAFGGVARERVALNEDTLWSGVHDDAEPPDAFEGVNAARALYEAGDLPGAERALETSALGPFTQSYLPLGDLWLEFPDLQGEAITDYRRSLDLDSAVAVTRFTARGALYARAVLASAASPAIVCRLTSKGCEGVRVRATLTSKLRHMVSADGGDLCLHVECPAACDPNYIDSPDPVRYGEGALCACARLRAVIEDGHARVHEGALWIEGARGVTLYLTARTSFAESGQTCGGDESCIEASRRDMEAACAPAYDETLRLHLAAHRALYRRVRLQLGGARSAAPTDERLRALDSGAEDVGLYELLFQYGRYLLICSSRPGTRAANLQGIWNEHVRPPWSSNYTLNINTQMNYWPSEVCALPELAQPLFDLTEAITRRGERAARSIFRARGALCGHNSDVWAHAAPVGEGRPGSCCWGWWTMAQAWLSAHLYARYLYGGDLKFLKERALPCLRAAARFILDTLAEDDRGCLSLPLQTSPENSYIHKGKSAHLARRVTMSDAIAFEALGNYADALDALGMDEPDLSAAREARLRMRPHEIAEDGRLLEWDAPHREAEPEHRHLSHLYGLFPGRQITRRTLEMWNAARASLDARGDGGTGWSLAWKINLRARLGEGDHALKLVRRQLRPVTPGDERGVGGTYPNLMDAHPPFQIDGNFGAASGIARLFADSVGHDVYLLGALPSSFTDVRCEGLRVAGGYEASLYVEGGKKRVVLRAITDNLMPIVVHFEGRTIPLRLEPGQTYDMETA